MGVGYPRSQKVIPHTRGLSQPPDMSSRASDLLPVPTKPLPPTLPTPPQPVSLSLFPGNGFTGISPAAFPTFPNNSQVSLGAGSPSILALSRGRSWECRAQACRILPSSFIILFKLI